MIRPPGSRDCSAFSTRRSGSRTYLGIAKITASSSDGKVSDSCTVQVFRKGDELSVDGGSEDDIYYAVADSDGILSAAYGKNTNKKITELSIPGTVTVNGNVLEVIEISENAVSGHKKLREVNIGVNVERIKAGAFKGCKKLKEVTIESEQLTSGEVASNAFKGIKTRCKFYVSDNVFKSYKAWMRKKGTKKITVLVDE